MYDRIKELTNTKQTNKETGCIRSKGGSIIFDQQEISSRWVEYVTELFGDERKPKPTINNEDGSPILLEEVKQAIKSTQMSDMEKLLDLIASKLRC